MKILQYEEYNGRVLVTADAYAIGDQVIHNGKVCNPKIPANTTKLGTDDRWWELV